MVTGVNHPAKVFGYLRQQDVTRRGQKRVVGRPRWLFVEKVREIPQTESLVDRSLAKRWCSSFLLSAAKELLSLMNFVPNVQ